MGDVEQFLVSRSNTVSLSKTPLSSDPCQGLYYRRFLIALPNRQYDVPIAKSMLQDTSLTLVRIQEPLRVWPQLFVKLVKFLAWPKYGRIATINTNVISFAAKQCYHCQGLGHVQADCPTLRINGGATSGRCYSCGQPGHLARNCPGNQRFQSGGFNGRNNMRGYASAPRPATCYKCGGPNHYARDCQAQAMKCYACGKLGHISRDCTAPNGGPLNTAGKTCYRCGEAGHISRDCPQNATTSNENAGTTTTNTTATTNATDATPTPVAPAQTT
ncbi:hypothetical protein TWF192_009231 [Orbilia oligospora]|nr:hypothetical protein TWF192_009231 [Orbilia oligospora]